MKLLVEYNEKNYVIKSESFPSLDVLKSHLKNSISDLDVSNLDIQYYDEDFKTYAQLTDVEDISHLTRLKIIGQVPSVDSITPKNVSPEKTNGSEGSKNSSTIDVELPEFRNEVQWKLKHAVEINSHDTEEVCSTICKEILVDKSSETVMDQCKKYAAKLLDTFPSLKNDDKIDSVIKWQNLIDRMCRNMNENSEDGDPSKSAKRKMIVETTTVKRMAISPDATKNLRAAGALPNFLPIRRTGSQYESEEENLIDFMRKEFISPQPRFEEISKAMRKTLPGRRGEVVRRQVSLEELYSTYPWLFTEGEIITEFSRICNEEMDMQNKITTVFCQLAKAIPILTTKSDPQQKKVLEKFYDKYAYATDSKYVEELQFNISIIGIPCLLTENAKDLFSKKDSGCSDKISIHYFGSDFFLNAKSYELCINGSHIQCTSRLNAFCACVAAHYAFNIAYGKKLHNFFTFIESKIFGLRTCGSPSPLIMELTEKFERYLRSNGQKSELK